MYQFLLTIALTVPVIAQEKGPSPKTPPPKVMLDEFLPRRHLDGDWLVVNVEFNGKTVESKGFTQVNIKNNHVTCRHDGREYSWRLEFGPHNTVRCVERIDGKTTSDLLQDKGNGIQALSTHHGVYIVSRQYFCLELKEGIDARVSTTPERPDAVKDGTPKKELPPRLGEKRPQGTQHLVIILQRISVPRVEKQ